MSRLGRNITANLAANAWSTVLSLLLTPVYVSRLGIESYALIGFYTAWVGVLGILDTGISATAAQELAWMSARPEERRQMPSLLRSLEVAYWLLILLVGAVLLAAAWWFGAAWFRADAIPAQALRQALMLMVVSLVMQVPAGLYVGGLMGLQQQVTSSALVAGFGTLRGAGAVLVLLVAPDIRAFFIWQVAAGALQTGVTRWYLLRHVHADGHPARFSAPMLRAVSRFAGSVGAVTAMGLLLTQIDKVVLSRLVPLEILGFYMLAWTVASGRDCRG
jgi:O-antigen/teichoic acid export membrane protein